MESSTTKADGLCRLLYFISCPIFNRTPEFDCGLKFGFITPGIISGIDRNVSFRKVKPMYRSSLSATSFAALVIS